MAKAYFNYSSLGPRTNRLWLCFSIPCRQLNAVDSLGDKITSVVAGLEPKPHNYDTTVFEQLSYRLKIFLE